MLLGGLARTGAGSCTGPGHPDRLRAADPPGGQDLTEFDQPLDRGVLVDRRAQAAPGPLAVQVVRRPGPAAQPFPRVLLVPPGFVLGRPPGVVVVDGVDVVLVGDGQAGLAGGPPPPPRGPPPGPPPGRG